MHSEDIHIPEPCHAKWDAMRPEDRGRFCFDCRKKVHDLSAMTEREAARFLDDNACNDICVSYVHADDGTIVFQAAEPVAAPIVPLSRLRRPRTAAAVVMGAGLAAALAACAPHGDGPAIRDVDPVAFEAPSAVIPLGEAPQASTITPPAPPVVSDEPCDPASSEPEPVVEDDPPRVRGRMQRTAGTPVPRKMGKPKLDFDL